MMSENRSIGRLEDKVAFLIDGSLQRTGARGLRYDVDARLQKLAEATLDQIETSEGREAAGDVLETYGNVHIGVIARLVAGSGTIQRKAHDAELAQLRRMGLQDRKGVVTSHGSIIAQPNRPQSLLADSGSYRTSAMSLAPIRARTPAMARSIQALSRM